MDNLLEMNEFLNEAFNVKGFIENVKSKIKKDISKNTDIDKETGLVTVIIDFEDKFTPNDLSAINKLAEKYGKYYKDTNVDGDKKRIYVKFFDESLKK